MERIEQMTHEMPIQEDDEDRMHYLSRIAIAYDVPIDLIRYEQSDSTEQTACSE
jgi:hypothetical protein